MGTVGTVRYRVLVSGVSSETSGFVLNPYTNSCRYRYRYGSILVSGVLSETSGFVLNLFKNMGSVGYIVSE